MTLTTGTLIHAQDSNKGGSTKIDCRVTNGINQPKVADAYPYLSADGLRLYFTSNREGGHGRFFISQRTSVVLPFGEPMVLGKELVDGFYAGTMTADELTLCMVKAGDMYISYRRSMQHEFSQPVLIKGQSENYHFGPAISPDGSEIIVTVTVDDVDIMKMYRKRVTGEFEEAGVLPTPNQGEPGPGQFSKDGLSYYFSLEETKEDAVIWRYSRPSVKDKFVDLEKLPVTINALKRNFQPSVNGDGSIIVFVTSQNDLWEEDDIMLVNDDGRKLEAMEKFETVTKNESGAIAVMNKVVTAKVRAYPNPFNDNITLEVDEESVEGSVVSIYDLRGALVSSERITGSRMTIELSQLAAGTYVYQVVNSKKKMLSSGKIVKVR